MLQITPDERRALELLANGQPIAEIAASLGVDVSDVESRLKPLFSRMDAATATRGGCCRLASRTREMTREDERIVSGLEILQIINVF